jgi:phosphate transport system substrate-binding protein
MIFNSRRLQRRTFLASLTALSVGFVACQSSPPSTPSANSAASPDAGTSPAANGGGNAGSGASATLNGAGASFPAPLYTSWFAAYNKENPNVQVSYQSVGSGAGVQQYLAGTVDFGASDAPLKADERQKFQEKYGAAPIQIPMTAGIVVFAYNLPNVQNLKLSTQAYCGIAEGKITKWNDPAIASANPGVNLPGDSINFVHRSDGSGTTFQFTTHLKAACPGWTAGAAKSIQWPTGTGAKGNEGVTAQIQQTQGAVGYVEYAYAKQNGLTMATLQNKAGNYVAPSPEAGSKAFEGATLPADFALTVPNPTDAQAYPISGLTWLLLYPSYKDTNKAQALKSVLDWALSDKGKQYSDQLGYVPLPSAVATKVKAEVDKLGSK